MSITSLAFVKQYLRIDPADTDQDLVLQKFIDASEETISKYIGYPCPRMSIIETSVAQMVGGYDINRQDRSADDVKLDETIQDRLHFLRKGLGV